MNDFTDSASGPACLNDYLAELLNELRLFDGPPAHAGHLPACLPRLKVAAGLLVQIDRESPGHGYAPLGLTLRSLLDLWEASPGLFAPRLRDGLDALAAWCDVLLARLDAGETAAELARDGRWLLLTDALRRAGTCLAVFSELEGALRAWEEAWSDCELDAAVEADLRRQWRGLRAYADALFAHQAAPEVAGPDRQTPDAEIAAGRRFQLLIDSSFRRRQLRQLLSGAGYGVDEARSAAEAVRDCLAAPGGAIICDDLEPSRNLSRVRRVLPLSAAPDATPVILIVSTGGGSSTDDRQRARRLGATGLWREPFRLADLQDLI